jgi:ketosteroid isomerase-like protein
MKSQNATEASDQRRIDEAEIRQIVENWAVFRDSGQFDRLLPLWHEDGEMVTTWLQVNAAEFVKRSQAAFERGASALHLLCGTSVDIAGDRAIAQTKMVISQRDKIDGVLCDANCTGRFYDFFEKRSGRWGIVLRQPIYEKDRLDPVDPSQQLKLDNALLETFPEGYRHLAYLQTKIGMTVKKDLPGLRGPEIAALYERGKSWLAGTSTRP